MSKLFIDVKIPYEPQGRLAHAYNRAMETTTASYVLFVDHDVFLATNPLWYDLCLSAIQQLKDKKWGWITARCNRIACPGQKYALDEKSNDIIRHIEIAKGLYKKEGDKVVPYTDDYPLGGFFILTNKTAWDAVGGFKDVGTGIFSVDNKYDEDLRKKGFGLFLMAGLYFYHLRGNLNPQQKIEALRDF